MNNKILKIILMIVYTGIIFLIACLIFDNKYSKSLQEQIERNKVTKCDCGWYQDFYYEHAEEVGAFE